MADNSDFPEPGGGSFQIPKVHAGTERGTAQLKPPRWLRLADARRRTSKSKRSIVA
jgi:hypothetical protein